MSICSWREQVYILQEYDDVYFILNQYAQQYQFTETTHNSQQIDMSATRTYSTQPICIINPKHCQVSGETANTIVFSRWPDTTWNGIHDVGQTRPGMEPTILRDRCEHANHYTTHVNHCTLGILLTPMIFSLEQTSTNLFLVSELSILNGFHDFNQSSVVHRPIAQKVASPDYSAK